MKVYIINSITKSYILNIKIRPLMTEYALTIKLVGRTSFDHSFNPYAYFCHSWFYFDIGVLCLFWSIAIDRSLSVLMKNTKLWQLMTSLCLNEQVIFQNTSQSRNGLSIKPCETMVWELYGTKFTLTISPPFLMEFEKFQFHYNPLN